LCSPYHTTNHCNLLGENMLGYEESDLNDMRYAIDSAVLILGEDKHPAIVRDLAKASDFLDGLWAEGYFE
jgi:hypothetical protein